MMLQVRSLGVQCCFPHGVHSQQRIAKHFQEEMAGGQPTTEVLAMPRFLGARFLGARPYRGIQSLPSGPQHIVNVAPTQ